MRFLSVPAAVVLALALLAAPASARLVKAITAAPQHDGAWEFPVFDDLGVGIYQFTLRWDLTARTRPKDPTDPNDPAYTWPPEGQQAIDAARPYGMRVLMLVMGTPRWANGGKDQDWAPHDPRHYAAFLRAAAKRYPSVRLWQVWGEPTRAPNWKPVTPMGERQKTPLTKAQRKAPRRYARLLDAGYAALKRERRSNLVIGGNSFTGGDIHPVQWVQNMDLPNGRPPRMDLYGHNPFAQREPRLSRPNLGYGFADFSDLDWFNRVVDRSLARPRGKRHLRLFLAEFTVPTAERDLEFYYWVTPETQAKWITSGFRVARQVGAYAFGWIPLRDEPPRADGAPVRHTGLIYSDGTRKPGYFAFKRG